MVIQVSHKTKMMNVTAMWDLFLGPRFNLGANPEVNIGYSL